MPSHSHPYCENSHMILIKQNTSLSLILQLNAADNSYNTRKTEDINRIKHNYTDPIDCPQISLMEPGILADFSEEFEGQVRDVIPDFDVPTVEDLREPIVDCRGPEIFDSCWCRPWITGWNMLKFSLFWMKHCGCFTKTIGCDWVCTRLDRCIAQLGMDQNFK